MEVALTSIRDTVRALSETFYANSDDNVTGSSSGLSMKCCHLYQLPFVPSIHEKVVLEHLIENRSLLSLNKVCLEEEILDSLHAIDVPIRVDTLPEMISRMMDILINLKLVGKINVISHWCMYKMLVEEYEVIEWNH